MGADSPIGTQFFSLKDEIVRDPTALRELTSFQFTGIRHKVFMSLCYLDMIQSSIDAALISYLFIYKAWLLTIK